MFTLPGYTKTYADMFNVVYRNKLYYSSYVFLKKSVEINLKIKRSKSNKVMDIIHPSVFIHDPELDNLPNGRTGLDYAIGIRRFFLNDFETAEKKLKMLRKKNPMRFEASYILGLIHLRRGEYRKASTEFKRCVRLSKVKKKVSGRGEQYINTFKNRCVQQVARVSFSQKKYKVTGIDLSSKMINICKKRNIDVDFRIMNILDLKFEDESFDGIWANASFIHIPKNEFFKGLNESLRILKKDGVMYISLKLGNNEGIENDDRYGIANKYMSYFSKDEIEKDLIDSGFSIIQSEIEIKYDNYANHPWINIFVRK